MTYEEVVWSRFARGLLEYIEMGCYFPDKVDYEVHLDMTTVDTYKELQESIKISQLSMELRRVAFEYLDYLDKKGDAKYYKEYIV